MNENKVPSVPSMQETLVRGLRRWSPSPLVRASLAVHGLGAVALAAVPEYWPGVLGAVALDQAVLLSGMRPRSAMLGGNLRRLDGMDRQVVLTFDDGPDPEVTPRVLDVLEAHGAKASFFLIGARAARHPGLVREILRRGHSVENHSQNHSMAFACLGIGGQWREIDRAQRTIADAGGCPPRYFRAPLGLRNPLLDPVLAAAGLALVSWTRRGYDTMRHPPEKVTARLTRGLAAGDILLLHDGRAFRGMGGNPAVLDILPGLLGRLAGAGLTARAL